MAVDESQLAALQWPTLGDVTWKREGWAKTKVVSGEAVREKQQTSYLSDLLGGVKKFTPGQSAHTLVQQPLQGLHRQLC